MEIVNLILAEGVLGRQKCVFCAYCMEHTCYLRGNMKVSVIPTPSFIGHKWTYEGGGQARVCFFSFLL